MDESSSGFGDESPILFKPTKKLAFVQTTNKQKFNLEEVYKQLLHHLKKRTILSRNELKEYLSQVQKLNPDDHKSRWLLMKVKGLLSYILKRRTDFTCSIVKGEITIYEKSASQQLTSVCETPEPPKFHSQPTNDSIALPSNFLTNNDFVTVDSHNSTVMEVENYNYSEDLFATESLHSFSQENFKILRRLTHNSDIPDDEVFKVPEAVDDAINKAYEIHDALEENYNSLVAKPAIQQSSEEVIDIRMGDSQDETSRNVHVFDDLSVTNEDLKEDFDFEFEQTEKWVSEIISKLIHLEVEESYSPLNISTENKDNALNESASSSNSMPVKTYYSEENFRIIREVCSEFKKNLEEEMKKNKNLEVLRDLLSSYS